MEPLEDRPAEGILGIVRQGGDPHAVAFDDEAGEAALEVGNLSTTLSRTEFAATLVADAKAVPAS